MLALGADPARRGLGSTDRRKKVRAGKAHDAARAQVKDVALPVVDDPERYSRARLQPVAVEASDDVPAQVAELDIRPGLDGKAFRRERTQGPSRGLLRLPRGSDAPGESQHEKRRPAPHFGPSGTNSAGRPRFLNHSTIASCGGFSIP